MARKGVELGIWDFLGLLNNFSGKVDFVEESGNFQGLLKSNAGVESIVFGNCSQEGVSLTVSDNRFKEVYNWEGVLLESQNGYDKYTSADFKQASMELFVSSLEFNFYK